MPGVEVPCVRSLFALWRAHFPRARLNFLSLDVEGAEEQVLSEMLPELRASAPVDVLLVEAVDGSKQQAHQTGRVRAQLRSVGYSLLTNPQGFGIPKYSQNEVWVAPWLHAAGGQALLNATAHSTPRVDPFVEVRHCGFQPARGFCNTSMRSGALKVLAQLGPEFFPANGFTSAGVCKTNPTLFLHLLEDYVPGANSHLGGQCVGTPFVFRSYSPKHMIGLERRIHNTAVKPVIAGTSPAPMRPPK